jgi:hypothetical protein
VVKRDAGARPYGAGLDVTVHARFTPELADKLVGLARAWGLSLSEALRRLVEAAVPESGAER